MLLSILHLNCKLIRCAVSKYGQISDLLRKLDDGLDEAFENISLGEESRQGKIYRINVLRKI